MESEETSLKQGLYGRHVTMIAVGGVIGAGFFLGVGGSIAKAGPAVIIAYAVGGALTLFVLMSLVEMSVGRPVAGSFQVYATEAFGPRAGFATGWTYWLAFLVGPASETIAAGTFLHVWFAQVPIWVFALIVAAVMTTVNLIGVFVFGEVEFWLSLIKVVALVVFIVWGCIALFHITPASQPSVSNLVHHGGFAPAGIAGIFGAMLLVMFSYGGTEAIGTAAEESVHPERDMPKILRSTMFRILVLFIGSVIVLVAVIPWQTAAGTTQSPFVTAFGALGGPVAANVMNFVVLTAALSCTDSGIYATSRMLYGMAKQGYFPAVFSRVNRRTRLPSIAVASCCAVLFLGALAFAFFPSFAYVWLASFSGFGFLFAWLMICLSHSRMRRKLESEGNLKWKAPGAPYIQWISVVLIGLTFVGQFFVKGGYTMLIAGALWLIFTLIYYQVLGKKRFLILQEARNVDSAKQTEETK
jgi:L-asparagine transporter-like permease